VKQPSVTSQAPVKSASTSILTSETGAQPTPLSTEPGCIVDLDMIISNLQAIVSSPADKRQLVMVSTSIAVLKEKTMAGGVDGEILAKLDQLVAEIQNKNKGAADAIQMDLVNTAWGIHKEWIKGLKVLIQLAVKY